VGEAFVDYYELLQVSPNADEETIQRVFRHLAKKHHPDASTQGDPEHFNRLLEVNVAERWARVEPGIVLEELNTRLRPHGLRFAPDISTASLPAEIVLLFRRPEDPLLAEDLLYQLCIEVKAARPPLIERHLTSAHGTQPIGRLALDRQSQLTRREQFDALETKASAMHRVFRVVAVRLDEFLSATTTSATVATPAQAQ
jgi:hypothetical protein